MPRAPSFRFFLAKGWETTNLNRPGFPSFPRPFEEKGGKGGIALPLVTE
jgi:hypothetical protein